MSASEDRRVPGTNSNWRDSRADIAGNEVDPSLRDGNPDRIYVDLNDDGKIDAAAVDLDEDGNLDAIVVDLDGDGSIDAYGEDRDADGNLDVVALDTDGFGLAQDRLYRAPVIVALPVSVGDVGASRTSRRLTRIDTCRNRVGSVMCDNACVWAAEAAI